MPSCPVCGFRVFNRLYPRCESCNAMLPETIAYSAAVRHALLEADDERTRAEARERPVEAASFPSLDDTLLAGAVGITAD